MLRSSKSPFELTGGRLCLDFANTLDDRPTNHPRSRLQSYADFLTFGVETGVLSTREARKAISSAANNLRDTARLYSRAIALRERIFRIFCAAATKGKPVSEDILALNADSRAANAHTVLLPKNGGFTWVWRDEKDVTGRLLWEITRSAIDLLTSDDVKLVRHCAGDDCDWLFIDNSRSSNRRWCEMKTCGNRHKARMFYRRKTGR